MKIILKWSDGKTGQVVKSEVEFKSDLTDFVPALAGQGFLSQEKLLSVVSAEIGSKNQKIENTIKSLFPNCKEVLTSESLDSVRSKGVYNLVELQKLCPNTSEGILKDYIEYRDKMGVLSKQICTIEGIKDYSGGLHFKK